MSKNLLGCALGAASIVAATLGSATAASLGQAGWFAAAGKGAHRAAAESPGLLEWLRTFLMIADETEASAGAAACKDEPTPAAGAAASAPAKKPAASRAPSGAVGMQKAPQPLPLAF